MDPTILAQWQGIVETMAHIIEVPSAIITRFAAPYVEVLQASQNPDNPYHAGQVVDMANHYCEEVFKTRQPMLLPNALASEKWCCAPEIDYGMVSYLGYPIANPDGSLFGTLCVLDNKENAYSENIQHLMTQFRALVEAHLVLDAQRLLLEAQLREINTLRGIIPICMGCKRVRNDEGFWEQVEHYVSAHSMAEFSHGFCPKCMENYKRDVQADIENMKKNS